MPIVFNHSIRLYCLAASHLTVISKFVEWFTLKHFLLTSSLSMFIENIIHFVFVIQYCSFSDILIFSQIHIC